MLNMPKTRTGKCSVGFIIAFFVLLALLQILVASGQRGGNTFFSNPLLAVTGITAGTSGVLSFFIGIFSIIKHKERSVWVYLTTLVGLFILIFVLGEILATH